MHLGHKAVLANGEGIRKDDVCGRKKCAMERHISRWPDRPVHVVHASLSSFDAGSNDGNQHCNEDGDKVDVAKDSKLSKRWRQCYEEEEDRGDHAPNQSADGGVSNDPDPRNSAGESVRASDEDEKDGEHGSSQLVSEFTPDELHSIGVVGDVGMAHFDLPDHIAGVDGDHTNPDR